MALADFSTTAASNTSIFGIGIAGSNSPSNFDNAFRQLMADIAAMQQRDGSAGTPAYTFASDTDTGFYRVGANSLGVTIGGTLRGGWTTGRFYTTFPIQTSDGSAASPSFGFDTDTDNGFFLAGTNKVGVSTAGAQVMQWNTSDVVIGKTIIDFTTAGVGLSTAGQVFATVASQTPFVANRKTTDGNVIDLYQDDTLEGAISVSGTTVTYGSFCGGHWSQLADNSTPDILRGTVMETIDAMCSWPGEGNDQLVRCKISETAGSRRVYGVFMCWSPDEIKNEDGEVIGQENPNGDMIVASVGAFLVRVASGVTVTGGDYLESNGDGCARVQADDIMRASTIAKVGAVEVVETYPDGSYLVPCTLHCG